MRASSIDGSREGSTAPRLLQILYSDRGGVRRVLELRMPEYNTKDWLSGIPTLLDMIPRVGSPAHARWALSCMAVTSERGAAGFLRRSELPTLMLRANASARLSTEQLEMIIDLVEESEVKQLPKWMRSAASTHGHQHKLMNARQVIETLVRLSVHCIAISELFDRYATSGHIGEDEWMNFIQVEQIGFRDSRGELTAIAEEAVDATELQRAKNQFADAIGISGASGRISSWTDNHLQGFDCLQFALQLLDPRNDAVAPLVDRDQVDDSPQREPFAHYWVSCSHNTCTAVALELTLLALCTSHRVTSPLAAADIVGDQLTGLSEPDMYRRQLLQGCRHVEIGATQRLDPTTSGLWHSPRPPHAPVWSTQSSPG
eukprot:4230976-Prymnesium_polylepis.2